jgi:hypothetical protein
VHYAAVAAALIFGLVVGFVIGSYIATGDVIVQIPDNPPYPVKKPDVLVQTQPPPPRSGNTPSVDQRRRSLPTRDRAS